VPPPLGSHEQINSTKEENRENRHTASQHDDKVGLREEMQLVGNHDDGTLAELAEDALAELK